MVKQEFSGIKHVRTMTNGFALEEYLPGRPASAKVSAARRRLTHREER